MLCNADRADLAGSRTDQISRYCNVVEEEQWLLSMAPAGRAALATNAARDSRGHQGATELADNGLADDETGDEAASATAGNGTATRHFGRALTTKELFEALRIELGISRGGDSLSTLVEAW